MRQVVFKTGGQHGRKGEKALHMMSSFPYINSSINERAMSGGTRGSA